MRTAAPVIVEDGYLFNKNANVIFYFFRGPQSTCLADNQLLEQVGVVQLSCTLSLSLSAFGVKVALSLYVKTTSI